MSGYLSEADELQCFAFFHFYPKQDCKMKQFCIHPLTPKICLLILSSCCYTFPCTFVSLKGRTDSDGKLFEQRKHTDDKQLANGP